MDAETSNLVHELEVRRHARRATKQKREVARAFAKEVVPGFRYPDVEQLVNELHANASKAKRAAARAALIEAGYQEIMDRQRELNALADRSPTMAKFASLATGEEIQAWCLGLKGLAVFMDVHKAIVQTTVLLKQPKLSAEQKAYVLCLVEDIAKMEPALRQLAPLCEKTLQLRARIALGDQAICEYLDNLLYEAFTLQAKVMILASEGSFESAAAATGVKGEIKTFGDLERLLLGK
jgi:hypothetical protein